MTKTLPVGLQLYGVRDILEADPTRFREVLQAVKDMGYEGVEFADLYGYAPEDVKKMCDEIGLVPVSAHVAFAEMMEHLDEIIQTYKTIGVKYLVMPYMSEEYRPVNPEGFKAFLPMLNEVGKKIHDAGMTFLYHNHDFEFEKLADGQYGYDVMFGSIDQENLQCELDTCWCEVATGDADSFVQKYAGRLPIVHLKDFIKKGEVKNMYKLIGVESEETEEDTGFFEFRPIGFGQMIWEPILKSSVSSDADWVIVEQDEPYDLSSLEAARRSREYLKILGW